MQYYSLVYDKEGRNFFPFFVETGSLIDATPNDELRLFARQSYISADTLRSEGLSILWNSSRQEFRIDDLG
jgi:hypothetical protein